MMTIRPDVLAAIAAMTAAAFLCRAGGYYLMGFVTVTPRVEAALRAIPVALIAAILAVAAVKGGPPEWTGIAVAMAAMIATRSDFVALILGVATVAALRSIG